MANLRKVIYINEEDYSTLINGDSLVIDGTTYTYEENALYVIKNAGPPEYAETAGYATNAGTSQVAVTDASGNNIAATYEKKPLIIEIEYGDTSVQSGTYNNIKTAIADKRNIIIKYNDINEFYYLPLVYDGDLVGDPYEFCLLNQNTFCWISIHDNDTLDYFKRSLASDNSVVHISGSETITGNKTFTGTVSLGSNATATTPAATDNDTSVATTAFVKTVVANSINELPSPMIFKGSLGTGGTITALPTATTSNEGYTYKVITDGTYGGQSAKIGDTFISDGSNWIYIPSGDEPSGTVTNVKIQATSPIAIDDSTAITTSGTRTISHNDSGVTAGTYKSVTVDAKGHVTGGTNPTTLAGYGITDAINTSSTAQTKAGDLTAAKFIKSGGTSTQFLKADGSVDSTTYTPQTSAGANALLSTLPAWTADPTDTTQLIRKDIGNAASFGQVTFLTVWNYIKSKISSVLGIGGDSGIPTAPTAAVGTNTTQLATTAFVQLAVNGKGYWANLQTASVANYITEPEVKSVKINGSSTNAASTENAVIQYDTTNKCIKFVFN